jgi:hypothetical protein
MKKLLQLCAVAIIFAGAMTYGQILVGIFSGTALAQVTGTAYHAVGSTSTYNTVKGSSGNLYGGYVFNPNTTSCYLVFYNSTAPTIGTTTEVYAMGVPAGAAFAIPNTGSSLASFSTGITIAGTTTDGGATVCSTGMSINIWYQ